MDGAEEVNVARGNDPSSREVCDLRHDVLTPLDSIEMSFAGVAPAKGLARSTAVLFANVDRAPATLHYCGIIMLGIDPA
jgi:hypothetical protein